ncbi:MAG: carbohydrate kinase family protein [Woeseiaceae bacterium]
MSKVKILVIGGASLDRLADAEDLVPGGAGMYTAMSAHRSGAAVTLYAPRPAPVPEPLLPINERLTWLGPQITPDELAHFEIHYQDGRADYVKAEFGTEDTMSVDELPANLTSFDYVHLIPLGDHRQQLSVLRACRQRGARKVSAGTALDLINAHPDVANKVLEEADILFMNEEEAIRLFGELAAVRSRVDQVIFVTQGRDGATVVQGDVQTALTTTPASMVDPTGAGDTFCGATIVGLAAGRHPVSAARLAMPLAAAMTERTGPAVLLDDAPAPGPATDQRVVLNVRQIEKVASLIAISNEASAYDFTGPDLPAVGHPATLDYLFATSLQQFGFWTHAAGRYQRPLLATIDGEQRKGAFYLFRAYLRWLQEAPEMLAPEAQATLSAADLLAVLRDDDGHDPMPAIDMHVAAARSYGSDMLALGLTAASILKTANASAVPVANLVRQLDHVGGYKEDPLRKKSALLAIMLRQRPETFLVDRGDDAPPIVDYHVMRSCLRIGLLDVVDDDLRGQLERRVLLSTNDEWAVRSAAYRAVEQLLEKSGKSLGAVDWFLFQARQRCPEMSEPDCTACVVDPICQHRKTLFQPVIRSSFY